MTSPLDRKIRITGPVVITANRLADGAVVYRCAEGGWTTRLDNAAVATSAAVAEEILADAARDEINAVGAYVAPVRLMPGGAMEPGNLRERIRAAGPTVEAAPKTAPEPAHVCV